MKLAPPMAASVCLFAGLGTAQAQVQTCQEPGPLAAAYTLQAASHPADDGFGNVQREHFYRFVVPQSTKLCSIGYEAPNPAPLNYRFRLYDCNNNPPTLIETVNFAASLFSGGLQYQPISPAWPLLAGQCYELHRRVTGPASPPSRVGRRLANETAYPIVAPAITITGTTFFTSGAGPYLNNDALPFIDFGTR